MDVSIIIINYNTLELTKKCIESIKEKTQGIHYEIVLVDNASTEPKTKETFEQIPDIVFAPSKENLGFAKGNNFGIRRAKGKYILLLNSDTELINDAVSICYNHFQNHDKRLGVVSAQLQYPDGRIQDSCNRFPSIKYLLFERLRLFKFFPKSIYGKILLGPFFDHQSKVQPDWVWGTFYMFPKKILEKLPNKKLADNFFMYGEDVQWGLEFNKLGVKIQFLPEAKVVHYVGSSSNRGMEWMKENNAKLREMYYSKMHRFFLNFLDTNLP